MEMESEVQREKKKGKRERKETKQKKEERKQERRIERAMTTKNQCRCQETEQREEYIADNMLKGLTLNVRMSMRWTLLMKSEKNFVFSEKICSSKS